MMQKPHRLAIIAPYRELAELAKQVCAELRVPVAVYQGDLSAGVDIATRLEADGVEAIISRGGTAEAITRAVEVPVITIKVTGFDILRALDEARHQASSVAVVGFANVVLGAETVGQILGLKVEQLLLQSENEAIIRVREARDRGVSVVVGDAISTKLTLDLGLRGILIRSGREAIIDALEQAQQAAEVRERERRHVQELRAILDHAYEGIIATDHAGRVRFVNPAAARVLGITATQASGRPLAGILPTVDIQATFESGAPGVDELHRVGEKVLLLSRIPVAVNGNVIGAVITFQETSKLERMEARVRRELHAKGHVARYHLNDIIAVSRPMRSLLADARRYAEFDTTVLIIGETGTGKELLAQGIHNASPRRDGPFVAVNCAALPESLLESELFGYDEGAFTGARRGGKAGLFELAHRGTIFLDEIGEISPGVQARLLRVLEEREVMRVGGDRVIPVDVRVIAATHRDLQKAVTEGRFRADLYYRLKVLELMVPPLRERREDIPVIFASFLERTSKRLSRKVPVLPEWAHASLRNYNWPGNVRELLNVAERIVASAEDGRISDTRLRRIVPEIFSNRADQSEHRDQRYPGWAAGVGITSLSATEGGQTALRIEVPVEGDLRTLEKHLLIALHEHLAISTTELARRLGISRTTLWRRLQQ